MTMVAMLTYKILLSYKFQNKILKDSMSEFDEDGGLFGGYLPTSLRIRNKAGTAGIIIIVIIVIIILLFLFK